MHLWRVLHLCGRGGTATSRTVHLGLSGFVILMWTLDRAAGDGPHLTQVSGLVAEPGSPWKRVRRAVDMASWVPDHGLPGGGLLLHSLTRVTRAHITTISQSELALELGPWRAPLHECAPASVGGGFSREGSGQCQFLGLHSRFVEGKQKAQ